jgi:hypothetical protein
MQMTPVDRRLSGAATTVFPRFIVKPRGMVRIKRPAERRMAVDAGQARRTPLGASLPGRDHPAGDGCLPSLGRATAPARGRTIGSGRNARFDRAGYEGDAKSRLAQIRRAALAHDDLKGPK